MKSSKMTIVPIPTLKDNYVWTLIDKAQNTAVIVDPGEAKPVSSFLQEQALKLAGILITHHHWDHTNGVSELKRQYDVPVFGPAKEPVADMTDLMQEPNEVKISGFPLTFKVLDIPSHTLGHIAYYSPEILFSGDTLFSSGCGRVFEGTHAQMYTSLQKMAALPDETKIYCGHEYTLNNLRFAETVEPSNPKIKERIKLVSELRNKNLPSLPSTLRDEKEANPFLRCDSPEVIASVEKYAGHSLNNPIEVFTSLRKWKDEF